MTAINYVTRILPFTLRFEGGYSNHPHDPGGATMHGITQRTYDGYRHGRGLPTRWVFHIEENEIQDIYRNQYWRPIDGDGLPGGVDLLSFDIAVNSGVGRSRGFLEATRTMPPVDRIAALDRMRRSFWSHLLSFKWFHDGWMSRENACLTLAKSMT